MTWEIWDALRDCVLDSYENGGADRRERDMLYAWLDANKPPED